MQDDQDNLPAYLAASQSQAWELLVILLQQYPKSMLLRNNNGESTIEIMLNNHEKGSVERFF